MLFGALTAFGFNYLVTFSGKNLSTGGDQRSPQSLKVAEVTGDAVYQARCVACHQSSGAGVAKTFPPLVGSPWLTEDKETPIRIVLLGLEGKIDVSGQAFENVMPRFADQLKDKEVALVLTHERSSWGNHASVVTEADVARVRASLGDRAKPWKGGEELAAQRKADGR